VLCFVVFCYHLSSYLHKWHVLFIMDGVGFLSNFSVFWAFVKLCSSFLSKFLIALCDHLCCLMQFYIKLFQFCSCSIWKIFSETIYGQYNSCKDFLRNTFETCFCILPSNTIFLQIETRELHAAQISYRLLLMEPEIFSKLWDWSCFLDLVKDTHKPDLTWCGVQTLRVLLKLGYKATENLNIGDEEAFSCLLWSVLFTCFQLYIVLKM